MRECVCVHVREYVASMSAWYVTYMASCVVAYSVHTGRKTSELGRKIRGKSAHISLSMTRRWTEIGNSVPNMALLATHLYYLPVL